MATSYSGPGGQGDRRNDIQIVLTGFGTYYASKIGRQYALIDGTNASSKMDWPAVSSAMVLFDFGPGHTRIIDEFTWRQSDSTSHGTWTFEGSNDNVSYTSLTSITLGGSTAQVVSFTNTADYRYYRLRQTAGVTNGAVWLQGIDFKIDQGVAALTSAYSALARGDRRTSIAMSTTFGLGGASILDKLIDGDAINAGGYSNACWFLSQQNKAILFDFAIPTIVDKLTWIWDMGNISAGFYTFEGSNDNISYTTLGSSFEIAGFCSQNFFSNTTAYRYYRISGPTTGTMSGNGWMLEVQFSTDAPSGGGGGNKSSVIIVASGD